MTDFAKLVPLFLLLIALIVIVRAGATALKADPMTEDDKDVRNESLKGAAYIFAAASLLWWFTPSFGLGLTILWTVLTLIFGVVVVLTVIELPNKPKWNKRHDWLWKEGRKTPGYSRSDEPVERIRWYRRIMLAVLIVVALFSLLVSAFSTTSSADETGDAAPAATAPADPTPSASAPATSAPATSTSTPAEPDTFANTCGGINPKKVNDPNATIDFKVGDKLFVCHNGDWKTWAQAYPNVQPPAKPKLTYWGTDAEKKNGYGVVVINNNPVLFWTTAIQW